MTKEYKKMQTTEKEEKEDILSLSKKKEKKRPFCTGEHFEYYFSLSKSNLGIMQIMDECESVGSSWMSCILFVNAT